MAHKKVANNGADLGFEEKLWLADKLRRSMDAAEYKHVVRSPRLGFEGRLLFAAFVRFAGL